MELRACQNPRGNKPLPPKLNPQGIRDTLTLIASSDWFIFFCFHRYVNNAHAPSVKTVLRD